jgi:dCTP deaminase
MNNTIIGTLNDSVIKKMCTEGKLIVENFKEKNVKQACYELRASNIYYDVTVSDRKIEVEDNEYILIKPKQLVVIMTLETLDLSSNMLGRILTKGKLFSVGLLPVNTYADPGFSGKLGIVFSNLSTNYLKLKPKDAIAKIEFCKLEHSVEKPYSGQHGYETEIWPIPKELILTSDEIKSDQRIKSIPEEIELSYGKDISKVIKRVYKFERRLILASIAYLMFTMILIIALQGTDWINNTVSILLGVISNILFTFITWTSTNFRR